MLRAVLFENYGLRADRVSELRGGWSALAYRVDAPSGRYFLKVYRKSRASTPKLTAHLDAYLPLVARLGGGSLRGRIVEPLPTRLGGWFCEDAEAVYVLFRYLEGETLGERELSPRQVEAVAEIVADLHDTDPGTPGVAALPPEDFSVPFCDGLERFLKTELPSCDEGVRGIVLSARTRLEEAVGELHERARSLKASPPPFVLCHTDIHGWNLIQGPDSLVLLDWEGLKAAPAEADLFLFADRPHYPRLLSVYASKRPSWRPNEDALAFYALRRRLEDIWEFLEQLTVDRLEDAARREALGHLQTLCADR